MFLTIGNWRSVVSGLSALAVLGVREIDVESGLEECLRLSLINRHELSDGHYCYSTPELAHLFAKRKLDGDPDRLVILEDIDLLRQFGQMKPADIAGKNIDEFISRFMSQSADEASKTPDMRVRLEAMMAKVSELWPKGWLYLAGYRELTGAKPEDISYALRRAVEEMPYDKDVLLRRAKFAEQQHDKALYISSMVSAVEADPGNAALVTEVAFQLVRYIEDQRIPPAKRGVYLASVRNHMQKIAHKLDATALSRLAWLFLLEDNESDAWKYANQGLAKEPENRHCLKLTEKLRFAQHA